MQIVDDHHSYFYVQLITTKGRSKQELQKEIHGYRTDGDFKLDHGNKHIFTPQF